MKFSEAFKAMKTGAKVKLPGWGGNGDGNALSTLNHIMFGDVFNLGSYFLIDNLVYFV